MRRAAILAVVGVLATACSRPSPVVDNAATETAVSSAADRALALGKSGKLESSGVTVMIGVTDRYGAQSQAPALRFTWRTDDLKRVSWDGMRSYPLLDLSTPEILSRHGARALGNWCIDPEGENGKALTPTLCGKAYEAAAESFMKGLGGNSSPSPKPEVR